MRAFLLLANSYSTLEARVTLARAVYSKAQVVLLDDILSAPRCSYVSMDRGPVLIGRPSPRKNRPSCHSQRTPWKKGG